jgi:hypothetical protein
MHINTHYTMHIAMNIEHIWMTDEATQVLGTDTCLSNLPVFRKPHCMLHTYQLNYPRHAIVVSEQ